MRNVFAPNQVGVSEKYLLKVKSFSDDNSICVAALFREL